MDEIEEEKKETYKETPEWTVDSRDNKREMALNQAVIAAAHTGSEEVIARFAARFYKFLTEGK